MAPQILALAPSRAQSAEIATALASAGCIVHEGYTGQEVGRIIRENEINAVIYAGELPGLSAERVLTAVTERVPQAILIIALTDVNAANALAQRFNGYAVPWPLRADAVLPLLSGSAQTAGFITPRREPRYRFLGGAEIDLDGSRQPGVLINVSHHGAMVLCSRLPAVGSTASLRVRYGAQTYNLSGTVKHQGHNANMLEVVQAASWLALKDPAVFGIELFAVSEQPSYELCERLRAERNLLNLRVVCIPAVPKGLSGVLTHHGVQVESRRALTGDLDLPPILLIDISTCSLEELDYLASVKRRSVIIGIASTPITDKRRADAAAKLPGVFVLPFQSDRLVQHVEEFFAPVDRKFPRIEEPFTALLKQKGGTVAADGINLSLNGCALYLPREMPAGASLEGTLAMDQAIDAYLFRGEIVWCVRDGDRYRAGINFQIDAKSYASYQKYLSSRFLKQLRARWEEQLTTDAI